MAYDTDEQCHHLVMDLVDSMQNFQEFDNVVSLLVEWGLVNEGIGAIAPEMWKEAQE
jgi:hypothetical protein